MPLLETETKKFYETSARRAEDAGIRQLLGDLAEEERCHVDTADEILDAGVSEDDAAREKRLFALQVIQPGLAGLMDGSVSTLAPLFAAAFATHKSNETFLVGLAASLGAGISMGFAEALSDDGTLTGRGHPWARGFVCGLMTALGGLGHTMPYLISNIQTATWIAVGVVCIELLTIAWVRHKYMDTPWTSAVLQIVLGGALVFFVGIMIGKA
jgi:rubrerythrin